MHAEPAVYTTLDRAIDDLLSSGSWSLGDEGSPADEDLRPLMDVAAQVLDLARRTPPINVTRKQRIWRRVERALKHWGEADLFLRITTPDGTRRAAPRDPAMPASFVAGPAVRPLQGVRPS